MQGKIAKAAQEIEKSVAGEHGKLAQAKSAFTKASREKNATKAINGFEQAWNLAHQTINQKPLNLLIAKSVSDSPDPYSPHLGNHTVRTIFQAHSRLFFTEATDTNLYECVISQNCVKNA